MSALTAVLQSAPLSDRDLFDLGQFIVSHHDQVEGQIRTLAAKHPAFEQRFQ